MQKTRRVLIASLLALGLLAWASAAGAHPSRVVASDAEDCSETILPASYAPEILAGSSNAIGLDMLVLTDGVTRAEAVRITSLAAASYAPLGIELKPTFRPGNLTTATPATAPPKVEPTALIQKAKALLGGTRPTGIDVVYVLTAADLVGPGGDQLAGYADCIGGVRYPTRAFAVGEGIRKSSTVGPFSFYVDDAGRIMAHEIGHLLGGQHRHANCVEGIQLTDITSSQPTPCTLMTANADLMSSNFGALEKVVVRGYAEDFARP